MTGSGTVGDPYLIYDVNDLQAVNDDLAAYYELANDIDASATSGWNAGTGFVAIGRTSPYFTGHFNGNNHTIDSLYINQTTRYQGLFGQTNGAVIENVILTNVNITTWGSSGSEFGGLVGYAQDTNISNCSVGGNLASKKVSGYAGDYGGMLCGAYFAINSACSITNCSTSGIIDVEDSTYIGGLVGYFYGTSSSISATINNCHSSVNIDGAHDDAGGLIGYADSSVVITNSYSTGSLSDIVSLCGGFVGQLDKVPNVSRCYATGNVSYRSGTSGPGLGGFVGNAYNSNINQCFATGNVIGNYEELGGFVGQNYLTSIANCYARGSVRGSYSGSFSGTNEDGSIDKCYGTGAITDLGNCGGLIGLGSWTAATASFWDIETTGLSVSDSGTGKTTAKMKTRTTFIDAGWNFRSIWAKRGCNDRYPCLKGVTPQCRARIFHHPTIPTEPDRGKELSRMSSL